MFPVHTKRRLLADFKAPGTRMWDRVGQTVSNYSFEPQAHATNETVRWLCLTQATPVCRLFRQRADEGYEVSDLGIRQPTTPASERWHQLVLAYLFSAFFDDRKKLVVRPF